MSHLKDALTLIETLQNTGFKAYIVGGYVRDYLLKKENADIDIATNAQPETVKAIFKHTILTGLKHGTVTVIFHGTPYEVTTFRTEGQYQNNRKPKSVSFVSTLLEDVKRRDFTMNALALDINGKIIDYVNGQEDIKQKIIRTVGSPYERFHEDALRMLRAFRFVAVLGFSIEKEALKAIKENAHLMKNISKERIIKEFETMLEGQSFIQAIRLMIETDYHKHLREFEKGLEKIVETKTKPSDLLEFLTICAVSDSIDKINQLPIGNHIKKEMKKVYDMYRLNITDYSKPIIFRHGLDACILTNKLNYELRHLEDKKEDIMNTYHKMAIKKPCDLQFKGDDIINLFDKIPGGWISDLLDKLCLKVLMEELPNDKKVLQEYLLEREGK